MARPNAFGDYRIDMRTGQYLSGDFVPQLKTYQVSIILKGQTRSTYHGRYEATSAEAAVEKYINGSPSDSTGAQMAQEVGGVVVVTLLRASDKYGQMPVSGQELFNVAPVTPPPPPKRARIVGRV